MTQLEVLAHACTAQVEIAVLHAQVVASVGILLYGEGRHQALVQNHHLLHQNLYLSGGDVMVLGVALNHLSCGLHHKLTTQATGLLAQFL